MTATATDQARAFDCWAIVDVMGHQRYAGKVTEEKIAGAGFIRVDVPEVEQERYSYGADGRAVRQRVRVPGFTKILAPGALHSLTPVTEDVARAAAAQVGSQPVNAFDIEMVKALLPAGESGDDAPLDVDDEDDHFDADDEPAAAEPAEPA